MQTKVDLYTLKPEQNINSYLKNEDCSIYKGIHKWFNITIQL